MISTSWSVSATQSALSIDSRGRVEPGPGFDQRLIGQRFDAVQALAGVDRTGLGHRQRPGHGAVIGGAQSQHGVVVH